VHHHFGEGNYEESEIRIRQLLAAAGTGGGIDRESGYRRGAWSRGRRRLGKLEVPQNLRRLSEAENLASPGDAAASTRRVYAVPPRLRLNQWALSGEWTVKTEAGRAEPCRWTDRIAVIALYRI
jgi:hypothetical protein